MNAEKRAVQPGRKNVCVGVRWRPEIASAFKAVAARERRSTSAMSELVVENYLRSTGALPAAEPCGAVAKLRPATTA